MHLNFNLWFVIIGGLLIFMALCGSLMKRLPLTTALLYLAIGCALGPAGYGLMSFDPLRDSAFLERLTEVAVIVSLFTAGLKLRMPFSDRRWLLPVRLAFGSMALTVGLIALAGVYLLGLSWGTAVLLGGILAPTDLVLASDVQERDPGERGRLQPQLNGEGHAQIRNHRPPATPVRGDHRFQAYLARGPRSLGAEVHDGASEHSLVRRHHLSVDRRRLTLPGGGA